MARGFDISTPDYLVYTSGAPISAYPFTMSIWVYTIHTGGATNYGGFTIGNGTSNNDRVYLNVRKQGSGGSTSTIRGGIWVGGSNHEIEYVPDGSIAMNTWHNVVLIGRSTTDREIYIDGVSGVTDSTSVSYPTTNDTKIGIEQNGANGFNGYLAEAALWDASLTLADIQALGDGFSPLLLATSNLQFYMPMIRNANRDYVAGYSFTESGSPTVEVHPPIIYPAPVFVLAPTADGGGGDLSISVSETVSVTDTDTVYLDQLHISEAEAVSASEAITMMVDENVSEAESVSVAEAVTLMVDENISEAEAVAVADTITLMVDENISETEAVSVADNLTLYIDQLNISEAESITVTDTDTVSLLSGNDLVISEAEAISVSDTDTLMMDANISEAEAISVSDTDTLMVDANISEAEAISVSDSVALMVDANISEAEAISVADTDTVYLDQLNISETEAVSVSDTPTIGLGLLIIALADAIAASDSVNMQVGQLKFAADNAMFVEFRDKRNVIKFRDKRNVIKFRDKRIIT